MAQASMTLVHKPDQQSTVTGPKSQDTALVPNGPEVISHWELQKHEKTQTTEYVHSGAQPASLCYLLSHQTTPHAPVTVNSWF